MFLAKDAVIFVVSALDRRFRGARLGIAAGLALEPALLGSSRHVVCNGAIKLVRGARMLGTQRGVIVPVWRIHFRPQTISGRGRIR